MTKAEWQAQYERWHAALKAHCLINYGAQGRLARFLGVHRREASRWINGERNIPEWALQGINEWLNDERGPSLPELETKRN